MRTRRQLPDQGKHLALLMSPQAWATARTKDRRRGEGSTCFTGATPVWGIDHWAPGHESRWLMPITLTICDSPGLRGNVNKHALCRSGVQHYVRIDASERLRGMTRNLGVNTTPPSGAGNVSFVRPTLLVFRYERCSLTEKHPENWLATTSMDWAYVHIWLGSLTLR